MMLACFPAPESWPGGGGGGGLGRGFCANAGVARTTNAQTSSETNLATRGNAERKSVAGCVISRLAVDGKRRESARCAQFDLDLAPARVVSFVAWSIAEDILVSQLHADFRSNIGEIFQLLHREHPAAGHFRNLAQKRGSVQFFRRPVAISKRVKDADRIELGVCFLHQPL